MRLAAAALFGLVLIAAAIVGSRVWPDGDDGTRVSIASPHPAVMPTVAAHDEASSASVSRVPVTPEEPPRALVSTAEPSTPEPPPIVLHVLDRETDRPLADAIVVRGSIPEAGDGDVGAIAQGASPLAIPASVADSDLIPLFVRAPGYAWTEMRVLGPATRTIRLARAGDLEVVVDGEPIERTTITVRRALDPRRRPVGTSARRWEELKRCRGELVASGEWTTPSPIRFGSLAAGDYVVRAELGYSASGGAIPLAEAPVAIVEGTSQRVALLPRPSLLPRKVHRAVTVRIAPGWQQRPTPVVFRSLTQTRELYDDSNEPRPNGAWLTFDVDLAVGRNEVCLPCLGFTTTCDIDATDNHTLHVEVPAPAPVVVKVVDADTGADVERYVNVGDTLGFDLREAIALAPGRYEICAFPTDYHPVGAQVEVTAAGADVVFRTMRECGVKVMLREGDVELPPSPRWTLGIVTASGSDASTGWCSDNSITALPGTYTLLVEDVDGYEPIPPRSVVVEAAKWTDVTIRVEPLRR